MSWERVGLPSVGKVLGSNFSARSSRKVSICDVGFSAPSAAVGGSTGFFSASPSAFGAGSSTGPKASMAGLGVCDRTTTGDPASRTIESNTHEQPPVSLGANALIMVAYLWLDPRNSLQAGRRSGLLSVVLRIHAPGGDTVSEGTGRTATGATRERLRTDARRRRRESRRERPFRGGDHRCETPRETRARRDADRNSSGVRPDTSI